MLNLLKPVSINVAIFVAGLLNINIKAILGEHQNIKIAYIGRAIAITGLYKLMSS
jgi:hypothetical protein